MKFLKSKYVFAAALFAIALSLAGLARAMRPTTYVIVYYSDAAMTQPIGYKSVSCNSNVLLNGVTSSYSQIEGELNCYDLPVPDGYWEYDYQPSSTPWYIADPLGAG